MFLARLYIHSSVFGIIDGKGVWLIVLGAFL